MNNNNLNNFNNQFQVNNIPKDNNNSIKTKNNIDDESYKEYRINYKLSLRKQKINEKINSKRDFKLITNSFRLDYNKIKRYFCTEKEIISGKIYDDLENAYKIKDEEVLMNIINSLGCFINNKSSENEKIMELLLNTDSSYNLKNNIKNDTFPLGHLLLKIGLNTNDKMIYFYCFNYLCNISSELDNFYKEITNEKILNTIFERLIYFHPIISNNNVNNNNDLEQELVEAHWAGDNILQFIGKLFISSDSYEPFISINLYEKIFFLFFRFDLNYNHKNFIKKRLNYLDTIIWLINLFIQNDQNFAINFNDKILNMIPCILNYIELLNIDDIDTLETLLELINNISDINDKNILKIVDSNGFQILINKICYLFKFKKDINKNDDDTIDIIIDKLLYTIINIFLLDSKYLKHIDFSNFKTIFEKLIFFYKDNLNNNNYNEIQNKLVILLDNLACFEDIEQIIQFFLMNKNIIDILFKYYYNYQKNETLLFIDNIMTKQNKKIKYFILDMGGFNIIKNNICSENNKEIINICIIVLFKLIQVEESNEKRAIMDKIYKTSIPEKIKDFYNNNNMKKEKDDTIRIIVENFDIYEKFLNNENK